jgi:hypothetical protein
MIINNNLISGPIGNVAIAIGKDLMQASRLLSVILPTNIKTPKSRHFSFISFREILRIPFISLRG